MHDLYVIIIFRDEQHILPSLLKSKKIKKDKKQSAASYEYSFVLLDFSIMEHADLHRRWINIITIITYVRFDLLKKKIANVLFFISIFCDHYFHFGKYA